MSKDYRVFISKFLYFFNTGFDAYIFYNIKVSADCYSCQLSSFSSGFVSADKFEALFSGFLF